MRPSRMLFIYYRLMSQQMKAIVSYQTDFLVSMAAVMLTQILGYVFLWVVFQRIPHIQGWDFWKVAFMYAMVFFVEGASGFLFNGMWVLGVLVNKGELDRMLIRPIPPVLQVLTSNIGIGGLGTMAVGAVILVRALQHIELDWTQEKGLMVILLIVSAVVIRVTVLLAACCHTFWSGSSNTAFAHMIHTLGEFARFPLNIYNLGVQVLITAVVPFAFISFFPAVYIFGQEEWGLYGLLSPLVAIYTACMALWIFRRGLRRYESTGN
ncbi:ABC transporter permease [Paenibacillus cremeus]|uniref:ABC transporter permease n=1 Tax=Paenibacillus cremeus TaxID=2163881 RepID=A0A559JKC4_9BACL|nr:ABC-2 family transporter protein [Paenibacillus cremeus]TVY00338.1 ABC transporter permease [Paenibacillus cremeus]